MGCCLTVGPNEALVVSGNVWVCWSWFICHAFVFALILYYSLCFGVEYNIYWE